MIQSAIFLDGYPLRVGSWYIRRKFTVRETFFNLCNHTGTLENYQLSSGEGLSVPFVIVWLFGDLCNLTGAVLAGLLPTVIIVASYYTLCDIILLSQIYFYRWQRQYRLVDSDEHSPLLDRPKQKVSTKVMLARYMVALLFVFGTGVIAWWISSSLDYDDVPETPAGWTAQLIGWTSAILYLGSRIPQIIKNFKTRCEGLSLALFLFAIFGNLTYVLAICTKSMHGPYLIKNASWLAGSGLTIGLDVIVLGQFFYYNQTENKGREDDNH